MKERKEKRIKKRWNRVAWMNEEGWEVEEESIFIIWHVRSIWKKNREIKLKYWTILFNDQVQFGKNGKTSQKGICKIKTTHPTIPTYNSFPFNFLVNQSNPINFFSTILKNGASEINTRSASRVCSGVSRRWCLLLWRSLWDAEE